VYIYKEMVKTYQQEDDDDEGQEHT
jgi:hypothetical protein